MAGDRWNPAFLPPFSPRWGWKGIWVGREFAGNPTGCWVWFIHQKLRDQHSLMKACTHKPKLRSLWHWDQTLVFSFHYVYFSLVTFHFVFFFHWMMERLITEKEGGKGRRKGDEYVRIKEKQSLFSLSLSPLLCVRMHTYTRVLRLRAWRPDKPDRLLVL